MERNNGQTIFLSVIGIATLLVAIIGATFAWFSTTLTNGADTATVSTVKVSGVTMTSSLIDLTDVLPGASTADSTLTIATDELTGSATIPYTCHILYSGDVNDLQYRVSAEGATDSTAAVWTDITKTKTPIITGQSLTAADKDHSYKVALRFKETGIDQNEQSGQSSTVTLSCELASSTIYYTNGSLSGVTSAPNTQANTNN